MPLLTDFNRNNLTHQQNKVKATKKKYNATASIVFSSLSTLTLTELGYDYLSKQPR